jgi:hypothetical protein
LSTIPLFHFRGKFGSPKKPVYSQQVIEIPINLINRELNLENKTVFLPRESLDDKIILVDMQNDAGINYDRAGAGGDMWTDLLTFNVAVTNPDGLESTDSVSVNISNCPGDFDNDKDVDGLDLATMLPVLKALTWLCLLPILE